MPAYQQDDQAEDDTEGETEPPAEVLGEDVGVQHHDGQQGATDRAQPVAAVDDEVDPAPVEGRDQLVDRRVDGRVLAADAEAGEEAEEEEEEPPGLERKCGHRGRAEVDGQGDHEEPFAAVAVRQPSEEQRPAAGTCHVEGGGDAGDLGGGDVEAAAFLCEPAGDVADDGDLESVEDPDGAEADHDHPVPPGPRQAVEAGRHGRGDGARGGRHGHRRRVGCHGSLFLLLDAPALPGSRGPVGHAAAVTDGCPRDPARRGSLPAPLPRSARRRRGPGLRTASDTPAAAHLAPPVPPAVAAGRSAGAFPQL